jgi:hypothetical protein
LRGFLFFVAFSFVLVGCAPGQSLDDFTSGDTIQSNNKINPLFNAQTLSETQGAGKLYTVSLKVPLTKDSLGSYDFSDIMDNEDLDDSNRSWFKRFCDTIMYNLANLSFKFGSRNKYSYTTGLEFPEIDSKYVKEVRIKKLFFSLEDCDPTDLDCVKRQSTQPPSLNFLKSFFLNVSPLAVEEDNLLEEGIFKEWNSGEFNREFDKAFAQKYHDTFISYYQDMLKKAQEDAPDNDEFQVPNRDELFYNMNVARYRNTKKLRRNSQSIRDEGRIFLFRLEKDISKYRKAEIKRHFKKDIFKSVVKDVTVLGNNLVVELSEPETRADGTTQSRDERRAEFFRVLSGSVENVDELSIKSFEGCSYENCASIEVNSINLVPLLEKTYKLKFDTFIELRFLQINDFLYNGFVEIEIKLDLPL